MNLTKCYNGHYYDANKYAECPYCENSADNNESVPAGGMVMRKCNWCGLEYPLPYDAELCPHCTNNLNRTPNKTTNKALQHYHTGVKFYNDKNFEGARTELLRFLSVEGDFDESRKCITLVSNINPLELQLIKCGFERPVFNIIPNFDEAYYQSNCDLSNANVKKAIERLEELCDKNVDAYVSETYETFLSQAKNKGIKAAAKAVNEFLKKKNKIIGTISEKLFDYAYKDVKAVAMYDWVEATGTSFEHAIQKLRKVDKNAKNYKELVKTVREAFAAAKKARLDFFKEMIKNEKDGVLKGYYQYAYNTIENASLSDEDSLAFMSLDDYTGVNYNPLTD